MKLKNLTLWIAACALAVSMASCGSDEPEPNIPGNNNNNNNQGGGDKPAVTADFARGADVSWVTELEAKGYKFYNKKNEETDLFRLLREECNVTAIRLRVWVNPANGYNGVEDVLAKAKRAHAQGMNLMIDFHMSDSWADPSQQHAPEAWKLKTPEQTVQNIRDHVTSVLTRLKSAGIDVKWVQIGNETRAGFLQELNGLMKDQNANEFPRYFNAGYEAAKAVYPKAEVIAHLDKGENRDIYTWFFDLMKKNNVKYDVIGMSLYPETEPSNPWSVSLNQKAVNDCLSNIEYLHNRYGKKVMLCEIGFHYTNGKAGKKAIRQIMEKYPKGDILEGIFYWEPEAPEEEGYKKGAFVNGRPNEALEAFVQNMLTPAN